MKTMYINNTANIVVDTKTDEISSIRTEREAIRSIYIAPEAMHVIYQSGEYRKEVTVEEGDLIITFYTDDFKNRMIVINSKEWVENLDLYNKKQQELREKWAAEKAQECCDNCTNCGTESIKA